jgi:hypothetical protein
LGVSSRTVVDLRYVLANCVQPALRWQIIYLPYRCVILSGGAGAGSSLHPSAVGVSMAAVAVDDNSSSHGLVVS